MIWIVYLYLSSYHNLDLKMMKVRLRKVSTCSHISRRQIESAHILSLHAPSPPLSTCALFTLPTHLAVHSLLPSYLCCRCPLQKYSWGQMIGILSKAPGIQNNLGVSSCTLSSVSHSTSETIISFWRQTSEASLLRDSQVYFLQNQICGYRLSTIS